VTSYRFSAFDDKLFYEDIADKLMRENGTSGDVKRHLFVYFSQMCEKSAEGRTVIKADLH